MKISRQHQLFQSLKAGDMIHIMHMRRGKATLYFCVVLHVEECEGDRKKILLSIPDQDKPAPVSSPFNPFHWSEYKQAIVDKDGDIFASADEFMGIERDGAAETIKIYQQIPRKKDVRVRVSEQDVVSLRQDPLAKIIPHIISTDEEKTIPEMISLVLDKLKMPHDQRQLGLLSLLVGTIILEPGIGIFVENTMPETPGAPGDQTVH